MFSLKGWSLIAWVTHYVSCLRPPQNYPQRLEKTTVICLQRVTTLWIPKLTPSTTSPSRAAWWSATSLATFRTSLEQAAIFPHHSSNSNQQPWSKRESLALRRPWNSIFQPSLKSGTESLHRILSAQCNEYIYIYCTRARTEIPVRYIWVYSPAAQSAQDSVQSFCPGLKGLPDAWSATEEAMFIAVGIAHNLARHNTVVAKADPGILKACPEQSKFEFLKTRMIARFADSVDQRLRRLFPI